MSCRNFCVTIGIQKTFLNGSMYDVGFLRCEYCKIWIEPKDVKILSTKLPRKLCPCCNYQLRTKQRKKKHMVVARM